jgi:predicted TIM-barrel fold metal-dependent hydrolase
MPTIDSDAHVIENMDSWRYLEDERFMPMIVRQQTGGERFNIDGKKKNDFWLLDGRVFERDQNVGSNTTQESREMHNVDARIRHMDELEVDVQVLYPTLLLRPVADNAPLELALAKSYNRWLADIWKRGQGRLRWVAVPPLLSMDKVRDEMLFAKEHGACGIFMRAMECEKPQSDPYFHPLYEIAGELDLPICFHLGVGSFTVHDLYDKDGTFTKFKLPTLAVFHTLVMSGTPSLFPKVRWAIVEASANWLPYVINDLRGRFKRRGKRLPENVLAANRIYVTCEVTDDLPYVLPVAGEENLVIGTDYGHSDSSSEIEAMRLLRDDNRIGPRAVDKILWDNPRTLYGLS